MVAVSCLSLVSPVGHTPESAAAAMRCGIDAFAELGLPDAAGEPLIGARIEAVRPDATGLARLAEMRALLFSTLPADLLDRLPWDEMPLLICRPERERPGPRFQPLPSRLRLPDGREVEPPRVAATATGPVGGIEALGHARRLLGEEGVPGCILLACDTMIDARPLAWLDRHRRLKTSLETDGVLPGEAGVLALVTPRPVLARSLRLLGLGLAVEEATVLGEEPFLGLGLAAALRTALAEAGLAMHEVDFRLSDVAGESYAFEELVLAQARVMRQVRESQPLWHPASSTGDTGAASALVQLAWAEQAFDRGYAPGPIAALHASSAFGARGAAIVAAPAALQGPSTAPIAEGTT